MSSRVWQALAVALRRFRWLLSWRTQPGALGGDDVGAAFDDGFSSGLAEFVGDVWVFEAGDASAAAAGAGVGSSTSFIQGLDASSSRMACFT